ncbi:MAG: hypothetical protein HYU80_00270 [Candidatus Blackburnbacteria bacterium]|nr:hypothetical protein [Candidatus Blackburnbacteria bacterium]
MEELLLIDLGSSSVKAYTYNKPNLKLACTKSIPFKEGFSEKGISEINKTDLLNFLRKLKSKHPKVKFCVYATAVFRKLSPIVLKSLVDGIQKVGDIEFRLISPEEESEFLELALVGKYPTNEPILLINIGGGSTELVIVNRDSSNHYNIDLGVGSIISEFSNINETYSSVTLSRVIEFVTPKLPEIKEKVKIAFYTGGELTYMSLASYTLSKNKLFEDSDHPSIIQTNNFAKRNEEIFSQVTLNELESLMNDNPQWMHGARACSAFAQAICNKYEIETIIPSNSNLINGVIRKLF